MPTPKYYCVLQTVLDTAVVTMMEQPDLVTECGEMLQEMGAYDPIHADDLRRETFHGGYEFFELTLLGKMPRVLKINGKRVQP